MKSRLVSRDSHNGCVQNPFSGNKNPLEDPNNQMGFFPAQLSIRCFNGACLNLDWLSFIMILIDEARKIDRYGNPHTNQIFRSDLFCTDMGRFFLTSPSSFLYSNKGKKLCQACEAFFGFFQDISLFTFLKATICQARLPSGIWVSPTKTFEYSKGWSHETVPAKLSKFRSSAT